MSRTRDVSIEHPDDRPTVIETLAPIARDVRRLAAAVEAQARREAAREAPRSMVGLWFHSIEENNGERVIAWQGQVIGVPEPGHLLVQRYEWFDGTPSDLKVVRLADTVSWRFYDSDDDMRSAYDEYAARRRDAREAASA